MDDKVDGYEITKKKMQKLLSLKTNERPIMLNSIRLS